MRREPQNDVAVAKRNALAARWRRPSQPWSGRPYSRRRAQARRRHLTHASMPAGAFCPPGESETFMQKYFGVTSVGGVLNVIMEAALCPLMVAMRKGLGKDPLAIVRAARDIALGLEFLHKEEMSHLALHPNNVLLNQEGLESLLKKGRRDTSDDVAMVLKHAREQGAPCTFSSQTTAVVSSLGPRAAPRRAWSVRGAIES